MRARALWAIVEDSWRESWARRASVVLALISVGLLLLFAFGVGVRDVAGQPGMVTISLFGMELGQTRVEIRSGERTITQHGLVVSKSDFVKAVELGALGLLIPWGILFGLFVATGLFSSMLVRGRLYLLLSKPLARWELYLGRYAGGVFLVFVTTMLFCIGIWGLLWQKTGIADAGLLGAGGLVVFVFAILYSFAALIALLTEGTGIALVATVVLWGLAEVASLRDTLRAFAPTLGSIADFLYYLLPKLNDLEALMNRVISSGGVLDLAVPVGASALFAAVMLALGIYIFSRRDY